MTPADLAGALAAEPAASALILDFDGTLAPIVDDPTTSALPDELGDVLRRLAENLGLVAVVSGRPAVFLGERAAVGGVRLFGLYGTEEWRDDGRVARADALAWESALDVARERVTLALAGRPGVMLEDKGLSVALHWRNAENREDAGAFVRDLVQAISRETGLAQEPGKYVLELRPPLDRDKGTCVADLITEVQPRTLVFVGDDRGDLTAFAAAHAAGGYAIAVDHGAESPAEVLQAADAVVNGTRGVTQWLRDLSGLLA